jgi:hypothetical protein
MSEPAHSGSFGRATLVARGARLRARAPRIAFFGLIAILSIAGLRSILEPPPEPAAAARAGQRGHDIAAQSFAEGFVRAYLTWHADDGGERERRLAQYVPSTLDIDAGLQPGADSDREVVWTAVAGARTDGSRTVVTVVAQTSAGLVYLSVPVQRDRRGFLSVAGYPALVGPPPVDRNPPMMSEEPLEDDQLVAVAERALTNYLARERMNLLADLTPDAVVSLPVEALSVTQFNDTTWVKRNRVVAVELKADDAGGNTWTLRYELGVRKRERWYVRSLHVDPSTEGENR